MISKKERFTLNSAIGIVLFFFIVGCVLFSSASVDAQKKDPIKIGAPVDITGNYSVYGVQMKKTLEFVQEQVNAKGGILGRDIEFLIDDAASDPAVVLRKCRRFVENDKVKFLVGWAGSDQTRAVLGQLSQWGTVYSTGMNGLGSLTASLFTPYFFRVNYSGPMTARLMRLYLKDSPYKKFMGLANDYVYGHSLVESFEKEIKGLGREYLGSEYAPQGTKDYSSWIARILQKKPDAMMLGLVGEDTASFFRQAKTYGLLDKVQVIMEQIQTKEIIAVGGDVMVGVVGSARYAFTLDNPENKQFVERWHAKYGDYPDGCEGETHQAVDMLLRAIEKAGTADDPQAVIKAYEGLEYNGIGGKLTMRACDHQGMKDGIMCKVVKDPRYPHPVPAVLKLYPAAECTPPCRKESFD